MVIDDLLAYCKNANHVAQFMQQTVGVEKLKTNWAIFIGSVWQCETFNGIV